MANYGDPRERLASPGGTGEAVSHVVCVQRDSATGVCLLVGSTSSGAVGLYRLDTPDLAPVAATAPVAPGAARGHTDLVRCATMSNSFLVTGGEDARVCTWSPHAPPAQAAPAAAPAAHFRAQHGGRGAGHAPPRQRGGRQAQHTRRPGTSPY